MARHELPLDRRHLHGHFSRELEPVVLAARIDEGVHAVLRDDAVR